MFYATDEYVTLVSLTWHEVNSFSLAVCEELVLFKLTT